MKYIMIIFYHHVCHFTFFMNSFIGLHKCHPIKVIIELFVINLRPYCINELYLLYYNHDFLGESNEISR